MVENKKGTTNIAEAPMNVEYTIVDIATSDEEMKSFLFTLGCYEGQKITALNIISENFVVSLNDAKYSIDEDLAKVIIV